MKTKTLILFACMGLAVWSCKKEDPIDGPASEPVDLDKVELKEKPVAEQKKELEQTAVKLAGELKSMANDKGVKTTVNLVDVMSSMGGEDVQEFKASVYFKILNGVKKTSQKSSAIPVFNALRQVDDEEKEQVSILEEFASMAGEYTYNFATNEFDVTEDPKSDKMIVNFPASKESKTAKNNDGTFIVYKPKVKTGKFTALDEMVTELPTELKYEMKLNGSNVSSLSMTADYREDGLPIKMENKLTLGSYTFSVGYDYTESEVNAYYSFKRGSMYIIDFGAKLNGTFTEAAIDGATETIIERDTFCYGWDVNMDGTINDDDCFINVNERTEIYPEKVLSAANAHFQLMDFKVAGRVNFTNLMKDLRKAEKDDYPIDSASVILNRSIDLYLLNAADNSGVARIWATIVEKPYEEEYCYYNENWDEVCETETGVRKELDMQMEFADKSTSAVDAYFETGFDSAITSFNEFIDEVNKIYGWKIEKIEQ